MFRLKYDDKNLDWNNPSIFDFRYIWYLARMVQERSIGIGLIPGEINYSYSSVDYGNTDTFSPTWNISVFNPNGLLTWEHLQMIYNMTMYLGIYVFYKDGNLSNANYLDGDNRKWLRIFASRYV
jgi:hypothetical protein